MADFFAECGAGAPGVYRYFKEGQWLESSSGKTVKIINPSTNAPVYNVQGEADRREGRGEMRSPESTPLRGGRAAWAAWPPSTPLEGVV